MGRLPVMQSARWCANCSYWAGERTLDGFFGRAEVDLNGQAKGKCMNMKGYYNQMCHWQTTCPGFTKHPVIKG